MLDNIRKYTVILASKSPRRRELMQMLRVPFKTVVISGIEEKYPDTLPVSQVPGYLSELKADAYIERMGDDEMIITADTVVVSEGRLILDHHKSDFRRDLTRGGRVLYRQLPTPRQGRRLRYPGVDRLRGRLGNRGELLQCDGSPGASPIS